MSSGASDNRFCRKCGYIFSLFETECPKCARIASVPPAASDEVTDVPDSGEQCSTSRRRRSPWVVAAMVVGAVIVLPIVAAPALFIVGLLQEGGLMGPAEGVAIVVTYVLCVLMIGYEIFCFAKWLWFD